MISPCCLLSPCNYGATQLGGIFAFEHIHPQMNIPIALHNFQTVSILQGKEGVHQALIEVNVRHCQRLRRHVQDMSHRCGQVGFRRPGIRLILSQPNVCGLLRDPSNIPRYFCVMPRKLRKKRIRSPMPLEASSV